MTRRDGLLPRMEARQRKDGLTTYRYHPVGGKPVTLGTDRAQAVRTVLDMLGRAPGHGTLRWLWGQWQKGKRWAKLSEGTQRDYAGAWKQIDARFGHMGASSITSPMVARYVHVERADSPRRADIEKALLSNLFKHGVMLGVCERNPTVGVEPHGPSGEAVPTPSTAELQAFARWLDGQTPQRRVCGMAAEYAALSGSRRVEFLDLTWMQVDRQAGVVRTKRAKQRGRKRGEVVDRVVITPALGALLDRLRAMNREGLYVFPTRGNNAYTTEGFETLWGRCMAQALAERVVLTRFNFHALRHYYVSEHRRQHGALPNLHPDARVTAQHYDETKEEERRAL